MINDEMRELLSAYVDGELRSADAARVENTIKRDPELRREVAALRRLSAQLRAWDLAENAVAPPATLVGRVLARVRGAEAARLRGAVRGAWWSRPAALAAGLLLALGAGVLAGALRAEPAPDWTAVVGSAPAPHLDAVGDLDLPATDIAPLPERTFRDPLRAGGIVEQLSRGRVVDGVVLSDRALALKLEWERDEARRLRGPVAPDGSVHHDTVTGTRNLDVAAVLRGYAPASVPATGLVVIHQPAVAVAAKAVPETRVGAVPVGARYAMDHEEGPGRLMVETPDGRPVLSVLGEVWIATKDGSGRTRIVTRTDWVQPLEFVHVAWADDIGVPGGDRTVRNLEAQSVVLGPRARQFLLGIEGQNERVKTWLTRTYEAKRLQDVFADKNGRRAARVRALMRALEADPSATGFAVVAHGKVAGVELFRSHELLRELAPRMLHGYLLELGLDAVVARAPKASETAELLELAENVMAKTLPARAVKVEETRLDGGNFRRRELPEDLRRVTITDGVGKVLGHGLVQGERPVQLSLFGG